MSQWLVIEGVRYDMQEAVQKASIRSLKDLQKAAGISVNSIVSALSSMAELADPSAVFDSVEHLDAFAGLVFLCKRKAGEDVSFDDACDVSLADIRIDFETEDEVVEDPKGPLTLEERDAG